LPSAEGRLSCRHDAGGLGIASPVAPAALASRRPRPALLRTSSVLRQAPARRRPLRGADPSRAGRRRRADAGQRGAAAVVAARAGRIAADGGHVERSARRLASVCPSGSVSREILFYSDFPFGYHNPEAEEKMARFARRGYDVHYVEQLGIRNPRPRYMARFATKALT